MQPEVGTVTSVDRSHQSASELRVAQAEGVADFMGSHNTQISAIICSLGPELILIKMDNTRFWCLSMGEYMTCRWFT